MQLHALSRTWVILCLVGATPGCATTEPNPWESLEVDETEVESAVECPDFPIPVSFDDQTVTFDLEGARDLERLRICSETNSTIVDTHKRQIEADREAQQALIEAGKAQRQVADLRKQILEEERRHHFYEKVTLWLGIVLLGVSR